MALTRTQQIAIRDLIKQEMANQNLSQKQVAAKLGKDPSAVCKHLSGESEMTPEIMQQYANKLGSLQLRKNYAAIINAGIAPQEYLDAIDRTPAVMQGVILGEMVEAANALGPIKLYNHNTPESLPPEMKAVLRYALDQLLDVKAGIEEFLISCHDNYGIDPDECRIHWSHKVHGRGHVHARNTNLVPMVPAGIAAGGSGGCA